MISVARAPSFSALSGDGASPEVMIVAQPAARAIAAACSLVAMPPVPTPVAAFARGGLGELLAKAPAALAQPDDVVSLAKAIHSALHIKRPTVREWVVDNHSLIQTARRYTDLYREVMVK